MAELQIDLVCGGCRGKLTGSFSATKFWDTPDFIVQPCKDCLDTARNEGRDEERKLNE